MRAVLTLHATDGQARAGEVRLPRGSFATPVFMPVGTQATVKAMLPEELEGLGAKIILSNAYHLFLRPGTEVIQTCGGLHRFMGWQGLVLTDSGGYQIFSLRTLMRIDEQGVRFRSHIDGSHQFLDPERAMAVQAALGSDIAMAFDHCPPSDAPPAAIAAAMERTSRWAERCVTQPRPEHQARFGIVQGGLDCALRLQHIAQIAELPFDGLALGGLSVGETPAEMHRVLEAVAPQLPAERPRYLMGVGRPEDLLVGIRHGIDMFDCVMPTRNARNGQLFSDQGRIVISNARYRTDPQPPVAGCSCSTCQTYSRAYLRHLYLAKEILYNRLATLHNLHYVISLVTRAREAILAGKYEAFFNDYMEKRRAREETDAGQ